MVRVGLSEWPGFSSVFSQGSALIPCPSQGPLAKVSKGGAVPNPCQTLGGVEPSQPQSAKGDPARVWLSLLMENHNCFA